MKFKSFLAISALALSLPVMAHAAPPLPSTPDSETDAVYSNSWLEIDAEAFEHNLSTVKGMLADNVEMCAVMKADAYGSGITLLLPKIKKLNIPCVGITSNEEARLVRAGGFEGRLMRLRLATPDEIRGAFAYDVEEFMGNKEAADIAGNIAKEKGKTLRVHVAVNSTGMSRNTIELATEQGRKDALAIAANPNLKVVGIMTHFPIGEEEPVKAGAKRFKEEAEWLIKEAGLDRKQVSLHASNTYGTLEAPYAHFDMVRPGRVLYGDMGDDPRFKRVIASMKSKVAAVNAYPKGNAIGYDGTYVLERDSLLANIPVGYSDGYRRIFGNKSHVVINGQRCPLVGKISMNTFMVDVTDLKTPAKPGDEVVLFGKQGDAEITQDELQEIMGDILVDMYTVWCHTNYKILKK